MASMWRRVRAWWEGRFVPYENDPNDSIVFIGGYSERHWTARVVRAVASFVRKEWKWSIGTALACFGLLLAYLRLP